jgi:sugar lactone lactonase YvrE
MQRREFLKLTAAVTSGMLLSPEMASADENDNLILGHGNKRYRVDVGWGKLDSNITPVKDCHEMVQDSKGRILLLTNETKNNVVVYDKSGKFLESWGTDFPGAHGLTLSKENGEDFLFISDNNRHQIIKTTIDGKVVMTLNYPKETGKYESAEQFIPTEVAVAPNGDIYVVDGYGQDWVVQYNHKGEYIRHFGGKGTQPENLNNAHGVCVDMRTPTPTLLVTSRPDHKFKRYTMDGQYLEEIHLPGAWVCRPVIHGDSLYAAVLVSERFGFNGGSGFVTILDQHNKVVSNIAGSTPEYVDGKPKEMYQTIKLFLYPHDVCVDDEENLYVAQWNSGKVYPYKLERV